MKKNESFIEKVNLKDLEKAFDGLSEKLLDDCPLHDFERTANKRAILSVKIYSWKKKNR
jgi:hypothetical protein